MATEELIQQISLRVAKLTTLHQELGTSPAQLQEYMDQLHDALVALADKHVETVLGKRDAMRQQCQDTRKDMINLKRLMGEPVDDKLDEPEQPPLSLTLNKLNNEKDTIWKTYLPKLNNVKELYGCLEEYHDTLGDFVNMGLIMQINVDVSLSAMTGLKEEIHRCENEYAGRIQQIDSGVEQIWHLWELLGLSPQSELDSQLEQLHACKRDNDKKTALHAKLAQDQYLNQIMQTISELEGLKQQREYRKQEILQHLYRLWDRLQLNQDTKDTFLRTNDGVSDIAMQHYEIELERMLKLKSEKVQDFISDSRNEMESLWNQLYLSKQERDAFTPFKSDTFTDALLELHEDEIERLKHLLEDRKYILDKLELYMKLTQEIKDFESSTNDSKRLFGKGRRDPGRLLREEKFRRRISKELPKNKRDLEGALREFQAFNGSPFTVYGETYLDQLSATDKSLKSIKSNQPSTPKRPKAIPRLPMTSPRHRPHAKLHFHTPQHNRMNNTKETISETKTEWRHLDSQLSSMTLHRVRQTNIRKKQQSRLAKSDITRINKNLNLNTKVGTNDMDKREDRRSSNNTISSNGDSTASSSSSSQSALIENVVPPNMTGKERMVGSLAERHASLFEDDDVTLDLDIFDDGPELSDMSDSDV